MPFVLGNVNCSDSAQSLDQCQYSGPGEDVGCDFSGKSAGVLCFSGQGDKRHSHVMFPCQNTCVSLWVDVCLFLVTEHNNTNF